MHVIVTMRSDDLPAEQRFDWWREQVAKDVVPTAVSSPYASDFRAVVTLAQLGPVQLSVLSFPQVRAVRTPALVRRSDPERYGLSLITANEVWYAQCDRDCRAGAGDFMMHDTSYPSDFRLLPGAGAGLGTVLMLQLPKAALPLRPHRLNGLTARRIPARAGMNAILARYLTSIATAAENAEVGERDAQRLGTVALDLASSALAAQLDAEDALTPETRRQALLARIEAFIELNLADPDLTPAAIAARHHISVGYLHRLFQHRELTITAWIRHRRIERARADLADPRLCHHPIHTIAARWGFHHPAAFSRAFRNAHDMPPGDYRREVGAAQPTRQE